MTEGVIRKTGLIILGTLCFLFFLVVGILQIYLDDDSLVQTNGTITQIKEKSNIVDKIYLDWWQSSMNNILSQGVKDIYEISNTYENLNILIDNKNVTKDIILNEILIENKPISYYEYSIIDLDNRSLIKIPVKEFSDNNTNKLTKILTIYNRYNDIFYKVEIDSFQFKFNFSKDSNFVYLNFENFISNFSEEGFKIESSYYSDNGQNFIYKFGHLDKKVQLPIVNFVEGLNNNNINSMFLNENLSFILYNRFSVPVMEIGLDSNNKLYIKEAYSLSNVHKIELLDQVFVFDYKEDNIFVIEKLKDGSVDIINAIDNYRVYFDENSMKTERVYEEDLDKEYEYVNLYMYRDLRTGEYVFTPNKSYAVYEFYDVNNGEFLSYDKSKNRFITNDVSSKFILTDENKLFDIDNRVFVKGDERDASIYTGDYNIDNAYEFRFDDLNLAKFKKVNFDEIEEAILSGNNAQVMLKNKQTQEFLGVKANSSQAVNAYLPYDSYLDKTFYYGEGVVDLSNYLFDLVPQNKEVTSFNLYSKVKETSLNIDHGFLNNKLSFDKGNSNKLRFFLEENEGRDNEFKIKDDYGGYLSFGNSDDVAKVVSSGFLNEFFSLDESFEVFEIYMLILDESDNINSGNIVSLSSKEDQEKYFTNKTSDNKEDKFKDISEYLIFKNKRMLFLNGENLNYDMIISKEYNEIKGIDNVLISRKSEGYFGYRFRILRDILNLE